MAPHSPYSGPLELLTFPREMGHTIPSNREPAAQPAVVGVLPVYILKTHEDHPRLTASRFR